MQCGAGCFVVLLRLFVIVCAFVVFFGSRAWVCVVSVAVAHRFVPQLVRPSLQVELVGFNRQHSARKWQTTVVEMITMAKATATPPRLCRRR